MSENNEVPGGDIIEALNLIKSHYKQRSVAELVKASRYVSDDAWIQLYLHVKDGYERLDALIAGVSK